MRLCIFFLLKNDSDKIFTIFFAAYTKNLYLWRDLKDNSVKELIALPIQTEGLQSIYGDVL